MRKGRPVVERFWEKVDKEGPSPLEHTLAAGRDPCWLWKGTLNRNGYGVITMGSKSDGTNKTVLAHRLSFEIAHGPVTGPLDHLCVRPQCVNPNHLELVTARENRLRSRNPRALAAANDRRRVLAQLQTLCARGHSLTEEGVYFTKKGTRRCATCMKQSAGERARRGRRRPEEANRLRRKPLCIAGHPLDGDNLYIAPTGHRACRECQRRRTREAARRRRSRGAS